MRFERAATHVFGSKLFSRHDVNSRLDVRVSLDAGAFLGRLWAHFGAASGRDGGFEYSVRDRETGLTFTAYSGASGPSYGGDHRERDALRPVIEALERVLDATTPADCEHVYTAEIDYGGGQRAFGCRNGTSFDESRDTRTPPAAATTYEQCVAIAREYESGYGAVAGWHQCLDAVLPEPPDEITHQRKRYEECVGFTIDDNDEPAMIYVGRTGSPENVPLSAITFARPLPKLATLWLESFARWKTERPKPRRATRGGGRSRR